MAQPIPAHAGQPVMLVTGASSGIGEATARRLAREPGASLVLVARREERLRSLAAELERLPARRASYVAVDLLDEDAPERIREHLLERYGRLDLLVNNAGASWRARFASGGPVSVTWFGSRIASVNRRWQHQDAVVSLTHSSVSPAVTAPVDRFDALPRSISASTASQSLM